MSFTKKNKRIAAFMGHELNKPKSGLFKNESHYKSTNFPKTFGAIRNTGWNEYFVKSKFKPSELKYHNSIEWLMPVVERIEELSFDVQITKNFVVILDGSYSVMVRVSSDVLNKKPLSKLEMIYMAVCLFVENYESKFKSFTAGW